MLRTLTIALLSTTLLVTACKEAKPTAETKPEPTAKPADPAKPAEPAVAPADPAKPAETVVKSPVATVSAGTGKNTELEDKGIAMMQHLGDLFAANPKDCDKLAAGIKAFVAENKPLIAQLAAFEKTQSQAEKTAFEQRNVGAQEAVMKKMGPAVQACGENAAVQAAMKEFPTE